MARVCVNFPQKFAIARAPSSVGSTIPPCAVIPIAARKYLAIDFRYLPRRILLKASTNVDQ